VSDERKEQTRSDFFTVLTVVSDRTPTRKDRENAVAALERLLVVLKDAGAIET
jgi:hypothetical protein